MLDEAKRHGYYEKYLPELEYSFTLLFYINTLFTYMAGVKGIRPGFVRRMGQELRNIFPDFQNNPYYIQRTHLEEKRLIGLQQKSTILFILYYKLLWGYRKWRKVHG